MKRLFSKRNAPPPGQLRYDLPDEVRIRILAALRDHCGDPYDGRGGFDGMLLEVGHRLFKEYGGLCASSYAAVRRSENPVIEHFGCCPIEQAIDFIEACFQTRAYAGYQRGVDEINVILREQGIGYELTPYTDHKVEKEASLFGSRRKATLIETEYPRMIRRDEHLLHEEVVKPALQLLASSKLRVANSEMLKAHAALRTGEFEDAITLCGSAFESVLKTICDIKRWPYDPNRDAGAKLVGICRDHNLFPPFYAPILETVATIRNKLGDAHGRGPRAVHVVTQAQAEHMLHLTSAHVLFLAKLAGLG